MKKLSISDLKVKSFVTSLDKSYYMTIKGGMIPDPDPEESVQELNGGCQDTSCPSDNFFTFDQDNSLRSCDTGII